MSHGLLIHEEECITKFLNTSLKSVGDGDCPVVTNGPASAHERALTVVGGHNESTFFNTRKNKDRGARTDRFGFGIYGVKILQGAAGVPIDLRTAIGRDLRSQSCR